MKSTYRARNGHERYRIRHTSTNWRAKARRKRVCDRLETQLKSGTKFDSEANMFIPLSEKDIERIKKEISTIKTRI